MSDHLKEEFSMQDTIECKQYPEYNQVFHSNEFGISYEELSSPESKKQAAVRSRGKKSRLVTTIATTVGAISLATVAVILSIIVKVASFTAGPDYLTFTLRVTNPDSAPLMAMLLDDRGEHTGIVPVEEDGQTLFFEWLEPNTTYTLRVIRKDNGSVLLERTYRTSDGISDRPLHVYRLRDMISWNAVELVLGYEGTLPDTLTAYMNDQPCRFRTGEDGTVMLRGEGFAEDSDVVCRLCGDDGTILYEDVCHTAVGPDADVREVSREVSPHGVRMTFEIVNPCGHRLIARFHGQDADLPTDPNTIYILEARDLDEQTAYPYTVTDTVTQTVVFEDTVVTAPEDSAAAELMGAKIDFFRLDLSFELSGEYNHPLEALVNGEPTELMQDGTSARIVPTGLEEDTEYEVEIRDSHTGTTIFRERFRTPATPPAEVALADCDVGYFHVSPTFDVNNPYQHPLTVALDGGAPAPLTELTVTFDQLPEHSEHTVSVTDTATGTEVYAGVFCTLDAGGAVVTLIDFDIGYFSADLSFEISNPAGHRLTAEASAAVPAWVQEPTSALLSLRDLEEQTTFLVRITDEATGDIVYEDSFTTPATPPAAASLASAIMTYFSLDLTFDVDNPYGHPLTVRLDDGEPAPLDPASPNVRYDGLAEHSDHTVTVTDTAVGIDILSQTVTTSSAGDVIVTLTDSTVNYFDAVLTFAITNPTGHKLSAFLGTTPKPLTVSGTTGTLELTGLSEKTAYTVKIVDEFTGAAVYTGTVTTKATPAATVTLASQSVGYFNIDLTFTISNPYNHSLTVALDGGTAKALTGSVNYTGLVENSTHTVTVKDGNTNTTIYTGSFTTASAGNAKVTLTTSTVNYFDAALTFAITNPAGHKLSAFLGTTPKPLTVNGTTCTLELTGLSEKTAYTVKIVDEFTGAAVYTGTVTTKATPAATVTLASQDIGYFNIDLNFTISNPYNHSLTVALDGGTAKALTDSVNYTGLAENSTHTVTVKDTNTGTTVYTGTFTTRKTPAATVTLRTGDVDCFNINLSFTVNNPYGHELVVSTGGAASAFSGRVSIGGLQPRTSRTVVVTDKTAGSSVFSRTFTTNSSVTFTQSERYRVDYKVDPSFYAKYPNYNVTLHSSNPINPDYEYIWFNRPQTGDQTVGWSRNGIYKGTYTVEIMDFSSEGTAGSLSDTFTVELDGYTEIGLSMKVNGDTLLFTVTSGRIPPLNKGDFVYFCLWDDNSRYMEYRIPDDFTVTGSTFTLPAVYRDPASSRTSRFIPTGYSMELNLLVVDNNGYEPYEYTEYVGLGYGDFN